MSIGVYDRVVLCFRVFLFRTQRVAFSLPGLAFVQFLRGVRDAPIEFEQKEEHKGKLLHALAWMGVIVSCAVSIGVFAKASIANYPGGEALAAFHELNPEHNTLGHGEYT